MEHIRGVDRGQGSLFPVRIDELIAEDHPVRVIDAFVDSLDCAQLGFSKACAKPTGRPGYDPADLLKLYIYGYFNRVRSSRRLEQETHRNIEVRWLLNGLQPDFKTIADFRRDNAQAVKKVSAGFVQFCRQAQLFSGAEVVIDGSKFAGQNARDRVFTPKQLQQRLDKTQQKIDEYLRELDAQDAAEPAPPLSREKVTAALEALKSKREQLAEWLEQMQESGESQLALTDEDARKMRTGQGEWVVGYNVQASVESQSHLIVHHELTQAGNDRNELASQATQTQTVLGGGPLRVLADAGYSNADEAAQCEAAQISACVPREHGLNPRGDYFDKRQFSYDAQRDEYRCPAGEVLSYRGEKAKGERRYRTQGCSGCALKARCTSAPRRMVTRQKHEAALEAMDARCKADPQLMRRRAAVVEHTFGTLKWLLDGGRLLMRGLRKAGAEMSLAVLAYNLRRAIGLRGAGSLIAALS